MFFVSWEMQYDENACTCGQLVIGSFITTRSPLVHHASCGDFGETSNHPGDSASLQPRFGTLVFPKIKITFERE